MLAIFNLHSHLYIRTKHSRVLCSLFLYGIIIFYPAPIFIRTGMLTENLLIYVLFIAIYLEKELSKVLAKVNLAVLLFRVSFINNAVYIFF